MTRRYPVTAHAMRGSLPLDLVDFLLGVDRSITAIDALRARGVPYDPLTPCVLGTMPRDEFLRLWETHRAYLQAEARRRNTALPDPTSYAPYPKGVWVQSTMADPGDDDGPS